MPVGVSFNTAPAFNAMAKRWELIDRLLGGTPAMRDWGEKGLPKGIFGDLPKLQARLPGISGIFCGVVLALCAALGATAAARKKIVTLRLPCARQRIPRLRA